ncbi:malonyl-ACP O-methyltransferase BioC [Candidatus Halobeggiatoa sp. HSG11]|nr:malonyl-ACP O-methyltransferase BioC [Candidatus Halobeggiatoa sp. HSG11]
MVNKTSQAFNHVATTYDQWSNLQKAVGEDLLERIQWLKINPQRILDIGAGTGYLTKKLSQQYENADIYAIDIALQMLKQASQQLPSQHFVCADATQLPIANASIDLLVSNLMLQWCDDIQMVFTEFARVLKPNGAIFFSTFGPDTLHELRQSWTDDVAHVNSFLDMHNVGDALLQANLADPVLDVDWFQLTYKEAKHLLLDLKNIGSHNNNSQNRSGLLGKNNFQAMLKAYEKYRNSDGLLPATYEVIYGHALGKQLPSVDTIPIKQVKFKKY